MPHPNHLGSQRKRWKLSHEDLAKLLGYRSKSDVSRVESGDRSPTIMFALGCEVVFGKSAREMFPVFYAEVEDAVMRRAKKLDDALQRDLGYEADLKRDLLSDMTKRAGKPSGV
jgi:transcriptional regulator with XRE-family HTH domain